MNYSKTFLGYLIKKYYKIILVLFGIGFLAFPLPAIFTPLSVNNAGEIYDYTDTFLYLGTIITCVCSFVLPIAVRSLFLNRKKCDLYLSLPLSARRIYILLSIFAYLAFLACFAVLCVIVFAVNSIKGLPVDVAYIYYFLGMTVISLSIFAETSLIASLANNVFDAVALTLSVQLIFLFLGSADILDFWRVDGYLFVPVDFADSFTTFCENKIINPCYPPNLSLAQFIAAFVHVPLAAGYYGLSILSMQKYKSENAGERSNKWYSYKLINTALFATLEGLILALFHSLESIVLILSVFAVAFYFVAEFIYQRKVKVTANVAIRLIVFMVLGFLLFLLRSWLL